MIDRETMSAGLREALVETLGVDEDEITSDALFVDDLGGESIDDLDLSFRLEQKFGIKTNFAELGRHWKLDDEGRLTPESIDAFRVAWPFLAENELFTLAETGDPWSIVTVELIERLVWFRLEAKAADDTIAQAS